MPNRQNFTGYILAGGKSSRMKRDKAFLEIGGKTFLENAFSALAPNCKRVKIVLNPAQKHFIEKTSRRSRIHLRYIRKLRRARRHSRGVKRL